MRLRRIVSSLLLLRDLARLSESELYPSSPESSDMGGGEEIREDLFFAADRVTGAK